MAREICGRLILTGRLVADTPCHVGGYGSDVETDLPLARDGTGRLAIPGTSFAGAFRHFLAESFDESLVERTWGFQRGDAGRASQVVVEDAAVELPDGIHEEIRDGVGIDREWGRAAAHIKYDRAILPRGSRAPLRMFVEIARPAERGVLLAMMSVLKKALEQGEVHLGAARTRGLGAVRLQEGQLAEQRFDTRQGLLGVLRGDPGAPVPEEDIQHARNQWPPRPRPRLSLRIDWAPAGPLLVKAGLEGIAVDAVPLVSAVGAQVALVLPGSSVKGALRAHAERIVRTLLGQGRPAWVADSGGDAKRRFLDAVDVPLVNELFGQRARKQDRDEARDWLPGIGALSVDDCYARHPLPAAQWQALCASNDDGSLALALRENGLAGWSQAWHVAIDRWLGSAADGMLYSVLEPHNVAWEPLRLRVNLSRLPAEPALPAMALLLLTLRDLASQRLGLGFGVNRGMGNVVVGRVVLEGRDLRPELANLADVTLRAGQLSGLNPQALKDLNTAWQHWIARNTARQVP